MRYTLKTRLLAMLLAVLMVMGLPVNVFATEADAESAVAMSADDFSSPEIVYTPHDDYYKVISKTDYVLAPGITESEIVLNNDAGSHRQVAHVVEVDIDNPYAEVLPSYKGMTPQAGSYGVQIMSEQAAWAEANGYGNVVAAMNLSLSWYDNAYYTAHPELVGEPLGYMILNGEIYMNSQGQTSGAQTCVVINFDEKDGEARPDDMPKVEIRSTSSAITGWEEQVIPANFGFLVKDGVNQYKTDNNANNGASRSFVGIKEDGTFVMVMNDGRQSPYSAGFTNYEMAEFMLSLGCVQAVNGDGGGSSAFLSQRPGEELEINCSPSDGAERPTTHGILVISSAPADGQFARANISVENDYYTPGSTVVFHALGTDLVGTAAEIPADATWQLADPSMGEIEDGVFISNGTVGTVTAQMVWNEEIVGEASVEIVIPEALTFSQSVMTVPFDKEVTIGLTATINGGLHEVVLKPEDVDIVTDNELLGTFNGFQFTSVSVENAPENLTSTLTATLIHDTSLVATASLSLGKGSEVLFDFESEEAVAEWSYSDVNGNDAGFIHELSFATAEDGQVHDGEGAIRLYSNAIAAPGVPNGGYAQLDLYMEEPVIIENAKSIGFWAYIPDEYEHCWIRVLYWYDSNDDGFYDKKNTVTVINQPEVYNTADENGWRYFSVDVSAYSKVLIPGTSDKTNFSYNASKNDANNFRFVEFMFPHTNTNDLWKTYGTLNGEYTIYVDNVTVDYSDAVDDREAPIFSAVNLISNDSEIALSKYETVTVTSNLLNVTAAVKENTAKTNATGLNAASAKAYVDGVEVDVTFANGKMSINDVAVADGIHRVKFEIADNMGNKSIVIRLVNVASGIDASAVQLVPQNATLDRLYGGSVYWMDLKATDIETIQSVTTVIDLNSLNHWELDHMELAAGFTGSYTIDAENNTAAITITRTGSNDQTGEAVLASLPIRVIYFDTDIKMEGYTAETYWNTFEFWPQDLKVDVDMGSITYVDSYASDVLGAFSNEEFSVDNEMYAPSYAIDTAFKAERGTCHVHTPEAVDGKDATCTENGLNGRTYCSVCDSVVNWGTVIAATGIHTYEIIDGKLTCTSGGELFNGVHTDGKTYVDGIVMADGWVGESYYLDGVMLTGVHQIDGKYYNFGEDGICPNGYPMSAEWWTNENGESFYFNAGIPMTEYSMIGGVPTYFNENGVAYQGNYEIDGQICVFEKGVFVESTTADILLAGRAGTDAHFIFYADGTMKLVGEGATYDFVSVGSTYLPNLSWKNRPWGKNTALSNGIKKVVIGKDITCIGDFFFYQCYNVAEVTFEEGSKLNMLSKFSIYYCLELKEITLPDNLKVIEGQALAYNSKLVNVYIPQNATSIASNAFMNSKKVVLNVAEGSYGESFAVKNNIPYNTRAFTENIVAEGSCGVDATWKLYEGGKLVIGGSGAMNDFESRNEQPWANYRNQIVKIEIGKDITYIGKFAFAYAYNVASVSFEEGSKLESLGSLSFYYIIELKEMNLPETVKSIGSQAFGYNSKLVNVYVPQGVISITLNAFLNAKKVVLNVAEGSYAEKFAVANGVAYTTRPFVESVVAQGTCGTNATWVLYESGRLVIGGSGTMSDFASRGEQPWAEYRNQIFKIEIGKDITYIGKFAFAYAYHVESITFEEGSKLENIGTLAIYYILELKEIVLPETVKIIGGQAFGYNSKLVNVYVPQNMTSIAANAFLNSKKVVLNVAEGSYAQRVAVKNGIAYTTRPFIEDVLAEGVCGENATWVLYESGKLVIGGSGAMADFSNRNEQPWANYRSQIFKIEIGKDITHIGKFAFAYAYDVESIVFEEGSKLESVGMLSVYYILELKEIVLPESVKIIGGQAFGYNSKLTDVYVPQGVTNIAANAFLNSNKVILNVAEGSYAERFATNNGIAYVVR